MDRPRARLTLNAPLVTFCWTWQAQSCYRPRLTLKKTLTLRMTLKMTLTFKMTLTLDMLKDVSLPFDLDLWPTTLTYNPRLNYVKVNSHAKYQGHRSNGLHRRARTNGRTDGQTDGRTDGQTDGWMDGRTLPNILSPCYAVDNKTHYWLLVKIALYRNACLMC